MIRWLPELKEQDKTGQTSLMFRGIRLVFKEGISAAYKRDLIGALEREDQRLSFLDMKFLETDGWRKICEEKGHRAWGEWILYFTQYKKEYQEKHGDNRPELVQGESWN